MMLATLAFTVMVSLVKVARSELSALEVVCWRGTTSVLLSFLLAWRVGYAVRGAHLMALRIVVGFAAMACFFTAAKGLAVADMTIITKLQPILVGLAAPVLLGAHERGGWLMALAAVLGVAGAAVLLGPQLAVGSVFGLWALVGAALSAGAHIAVRALSTRNPPETVVFWFQAGAVALAVTLLLTTTGTVPLPPVHLWPHLLGCGVAATVGQVLMTRAYAADPAPVVAAASYVAPLWGLAGDLLLFGQYPAAPALFGGGLIVMAGLLLLSSRPGASEAPESAKG